MNPTNKPEFSPHAWSRPAASCCPDRSPTREATFPALPPRLESGDEVGGFCVVREIACGSNSSVYEAKEASTDHGVALKVLSAHLATEPLAVSRFRTEAALAERVRHPSLLPIYGSGRDKDYNFYVMRLESGQTLEDLTTDAALHRDDAYYLHMAECFISLVRAVHLLHEGGIVHRDVKPSNILVDADGRFVLSDFGSALDSLQRDRRFEDGAGGTVLYMSPRQLTPGADLYEPGGDLYGLGLTLYELLAGTSPFPHCGDEDMARLKLTRLPPAPRYLNPYIPMALDAVIRRAIEIHAPLQYRSAEEMALDIERFTARKRQSPHR